MATTLRKRRNVLAPSETGDNNTHKAVASACNGDAVECEARSEDTISEDNENESVGVQQTTSPAVSVSNGDVWETVVESAPIVSPLAIKALSSHFGSDIARYEQETCGGALHETRARHIDEDATRTCTSLRHNTHMSRDTIVPQAKWESDAVFTWRIHFAALCVYGFCAAALFASSIVVGDTNSIRVAIGTVMLFMATTHLKALSPFGNAFMRTTYAKHYANGRSCGSAMRMFVRMSVTAIACEVILGVSDVPHMMIVACLGASMSYLWANAAEARAANFCKVLRSFSSPYAQVTILNVRTENGREQRLASDPRQRTHGIETTTAGGACVYAHSKNVPTSYREARAFSATLIAGMRALNIDPSMVYDEHHCTEGIRSEDNDHTGTVAEEALWYNTIMPSLISLCDYPESEARGGMLVYFAYLAVLFSFLFGSGNNVLGHDSNDFMSCVGVCIGCAAVVPLCALSMLAYSRDKSTHMRSVRAFVTNRLVICEGIADGCMLIALSALLYANAHWNVVVFR